MDHLQQLKDFEEDLANEKEALAQEMQERRRAEVLGNNQILHVRLHQKRVT